MSNKKATHEYLKKIIENLFDYSQKLLEETPDCLKNTSWFFVEHQISFYRYNAYIKDESIDAGLRRQLKDYFCYMTSCLDMRNQKYLHLCKKNKIPFTPEELIAWKRYHKTLDSWAWDQEHQQRIEERIAANQYGLEPYME